MENKCKLVVIEDDAMVQKIISIVVKDHFPEIDLVGTASSVDAGYELITTQQPNLIISDIKLVDGTAFDILNRIESPDFKIIFITAYHEYHVEALKFASIDFIFKPFDISELVMSIDKNLLELSGRKTNHKVAVQTLIENIHSNRMKLVLQGDVSTIVVNPREILYARSETIGTTFFMFNKSSFFTDTPLRRYETILNPHGFVRCHPLYVVNRLHIDFIEPIEGFISMKTSEIIPLELRRYNQFIK